MGTLSTHAMLVAYQLGLGPRPSEQPDQDLVRILDSSGPPAPGRALDLGCGTGRNSVYLASHGWEVTGVDRTARELATARRRAAAVGVRPNFIEGDVSQLNRLHLTGEYQLMVDTGCLHLVPPARRSGYLDGVTALAAADALLVLVAFSRGLGPGLTAQGISELFTGWTVEQAGPVEPPEALTYVTGPPPVRYAMAHNWFRPWRYRLRRETTFM